MSLWKKLGGTRRRRDVTGAGVLLVLALVSIYLVMGGARSAKLHIVNALDMPVVVEIGGRTVAVDAQSQSVMVLANGPYLATTTTKDGKLVERAVVVADSHPDAVVYNVAGAAPLIDARLRYSMGPKTHDGTGDVNFHGGERVALIEDSDYVFVEPPKSISSQKSGGDIVKRALMVPKGGGAATATYLLGTGRGPEVVELERALLRIDSSSLKTLNFASEAAYAAYGGDEAIVSLVGPLVRTLPVTNDDMAARLLMSDGCRYACDDVMQIVSSSAPKDNIARRLTLLRGQDEADVRRSLAELASSNGTDPNVLRSLGWLALVDGKWNECIDLFAAASKSPEADLDVEERAYCLHAAGRHTEALEVAARVADAHGDAAWLAALTYARIAAVRKEPFGAYIDKMEQDPADRAATKAIWLGAFDRSAPKPPDDSPLASALAVVVAASQSADAGMDAVKKKPALARHLPQVITLVLGGELARRGELLAAERVLDATRGFRLPSSVVIDYVLRGTVPRLMYRIEPEQRAALEFVRARRLEQLGLDSHLLYASARKRDLLQGWVGRLMGAWAAPDRQNDVLVYAPAAAAPPGPPAKR